MDELRKISGHDAPDCESKAALVTWSIAGWLCPKPLLVALSGVILFWTNLMRLSAAGPSGATSKKQLSPGGGTGRWGASKLRGCGSSAPLAPAASGAGLQQQSAVADHAQSPLARTPWLPATATFTQYGVRG